MEERLEQYRRQKQRQTKINDIKTKIRKFLPRWPSMTEKSDVQINIKEDKPNASDNESNFSVDLKDLDEPKEIINDEGSKGLKYTLWAVYFVFWLTLYIIAIKLKFGIVFLMFSALIGIYLNTRTGPKKHNEISAYSVFNRNFVAIDGTLKAEHFEREIRYGPASMK